VNRSAEAARTALNVLVVDDERLARDKLRRFLSVIRDVRVIGEAANGAEAVRMIRSARPDIVFLDVQMPGMDGFAVIDEIPDDAVPAIVFVTAHDEYAIRAFRVEAVDYLLKPFDRSRLERTIDRVRRQHFDPTDIVERVRRLVGGQGLGSRPLRRLAVRSAGRIHSIRVEDVDWFEAADNYLKLHTARTAPMIRGTLSDLEQRIDPTQFVRAHRSAIVRIESIREVQSLFHGDYEIVLKTGERLPVGRKYRESVLEAMGGRRS
jgi:two-component system LytT family response regulator